MTVATTPTRLLTPAGLQVPGAWRWNSDQPLAVVLSIPHSMYRATEVVFSREILMAAVFSDETQGLGRVRLRRMGCRICLSCVNPDVMVSASVADVERHLDGTEKICAPCWLAECDGARCFEHRAVMDCLDAALARILSEEKA